MQGYFFKKNKTSNTVTNNQANSVKTDKILFTSFQHSIQKGENDALNFIKQCPPKSKWYIIKFLINNYIDSFRKNPIEMGISYQNEISDQLTRNRKLSTRSNKTRDDNTQTQPEDDQQNTKTKQLQKWLRVLNSKIQKIGENTTNSQTQQITITNLSKQQQQNISQLNTISSNLVTNIKYIFDKNTTKIKEIQQQLIKSNQSNKMNLSKLLKQEQEIRNLKQNKNYDVKGIKNVFQEFKKYYESNKATPQYKDIIKKQIKEFGDKYLNNKLNKGYNRPKQASSDQQDIQFSIKKVKSVQPHKKQQHSPSNIPICPLIFMSQSTIFANIFQISKVNAKSQILNSLFKQIQFFMMLKIKRIELLYKYQKDTSSLNPLKIIQNKSPLLLICQLKNNNRIIGGLSDNGVNIDRLSSGFIYSCKSDTDLKSKEDFKVYTMTDRYKNKSISPSDPYYLKFGNCDIRIKVGTSEIYSSFGLQTSYFKSSQSYKIDDFLGCGLQRQTQLQTYQLYEIKIDD